MEKATHNTFCFPSRKIAKNFGRKNFPYTQLQDHRRCVLLDDFQDTLQSNHYMFSLFHHMVSIVSHQTRLYSQSIPQYWQVRAALPPLVLAGKGFQKTDFDIGHFRIEFESLKPQYISENLWKYLVKGVSWILSYIFMTLSKKKKMKEHFLPLPHWCMYRSIP